MTTIGVVIIGFPYMTFLPSLADERYDVGAGGYGLMSGVAGLGAVAAGVLVAAGSVGACSGRGRRSRWRAPRSASP